VLQHKDGRFDWIDAPALSAINARLRDDYIDDCAPVLRAWNRVIADAGIAFELTLPHRAFHRKVGDYSRLFVTPAGDIVDAATWQRSETEWLPAASDLEYVSSLMRPCHAVGEFAPWIAAPASGVGGKPGDFEYVRLAS
jgi:benzoyl-CoA 2,3-dioxygenase component B